MSNLIGKKYFVLGDNKGYVKLIDVMPNPSLRENADLSIVEAARMSFDGQLKGDEKDKKLIDYLMKNNHCYHPEMEVLTIEGWKKWKDCKEWEHYLIPDINTGRLVKEYLELKKFYIEDDLVLYHNNRMSFSVTKNHRMFFKEKDYRGNKKVNNFEIFCAEDMPKWGHFKGIDEFSYVGSFKDKNPFFQLIGFYLGDGHRYSKNKISFRLKFNRKIEYIKQVLNSCSINFEEKLTSDNVTEIKLNIPDYMDYYINLDGKLETKEFYLDNVKLLRDEDINGLFDGLINSDGSLRKDKKQIQFCTNSENLNKLFVLLSSLIGRDCHKTGETFTSYDKKSRTSLESRKNYFSKQLNYKGNVYCTTSSTGLLLVRGAEDKFAFVCGNSSPFEMVQYTFEIYCPLPIAVQWMRHRTASYNQLSRRYTDENIEFYIPEWRGQDENNKQASNVVLDFDGLENMTKMYQELLLKSKIFYDYLLDMGVSNEQARFALPQALYTKFRFSMNLRNLFHFLQLRADKHAQWEIQQYAVCVYDKFVKNINKWSCESFEKYNSFGNHYCDIKDIIEDEYGFYIEINGETISHDNKKDLIKNLEQHFIVTNLIEG